MPKSFIAQFSSRKLHLFYGTAIGVVLAIGATEKVYAVCTAPPSPGADVGTCSGNNGNLNFSGGDDIVAIVDGGVVNPDFLGGTGNDQLTVSHGSIGDDVQGNIGNDIIVLGGSGSVVVGDDVRGDEGNDTITIGSATVVGDVLGNDGSDTVSITGGDIQGAAVDLGADNDSLVMTAGVIGSAGAQIRGGAGDDQITVTGGLIEDEIRGQAGNDTITFSGAIAEQLDGGEDNDLIVVGDAGVLLSASAGIVGDLGEDVILISGGQIFGEVNAGGDNDQVTMTAGSVGSDVRGDLGDDVLFVGAATITGGLRGQDGNDILVVDGALVGDNVDGDEGDDRITMTGGLVGTELLGGGGNDTITFAGGQVGDGANEHLEGNDGNDRITITGGLIANAVLGGTGEDQIAMTGGFVGIGLRGNAGNDQITVTGGSISLGIQGNNGEDQITITGGTIDENVEGGDGQDTISIAGGSIGEEVRGDGGNDLITVVGGGVGGNVLGGEGLDRLFLAGGSMGDVLGGDDNDVIEVSGTADLQSDVISGQAGDDFMRIANAADLSGAQILGETGNDVMELAGTSGELSGVDSLFGGSGSNDIAVFSGFEGVISETFGAYEQMLLLGNTTLDVHNPNSPTVNNITLGEFFSGTDEFIIYLDPTSTMFAGGTSPGDTTILGNVANEGQLSMLDGTANDNFTVTGAYAGGGTGQLALDAELDVTEIGDRFFFGSVENVDVPPPIGPTLVPAGSLPEGTTAVVVNDVGDGIGQLTGNQAGDGIPVIDVSGGSTDGDDFFLLGGPIQAGAVEYDLVLKEDNIWYLQSHFLDQVFGYAAAPSAILSMARDYMGNLHERVGSLEQTWTGGATQISDGSGVWLRSGGSFGKVDSGKAYQEFDYRQNHWFAQVGADLALMSDASTGQLIGSVMGHAGYSNTRHDADGNELVTQNYIHSYGGGVAFTWYGGPAGGWAGEGLYVDGIGQVTFYDLETKTEAEGKRGETDGWGWSVGLEAGYGINLGDRDGPRLVPQLQIVYSQINLDDFTDEEGVEVEFDNADSLEGRLGVAIDSGKMWRSVNAYAEANIIHEFLGETDVTVTTLPVDYDLGGTSVEVGLGGTVSLLDSVFLYADVDYRIPFNEGKSGAGVIGGLRVAF